MANVFFYGCSGLTSVTIPSGVTSIGSAAFSGCSGLNFVNVMYGDQGDIDTVKGLYAWPSRIVFVGMLPDPIFVPESGAVFDGSLKVSITNAVAGAAIYYTTDGSVPTTESPVYERPFAIDDTTTVRAIAAEHPDYFDSEIVTRTFVRKWEVVKTPVLQSYYGSVQSGTPTTELRP